MKRFREILVLVSPDPEAAEVIARAEELAARNRGRITLYDVVPELGERYRSLNHVGSPIDVQQLLVDARRRELEELAGRVMTVDIRVAVDVGVRFLLAVRRVLDYNHDLIITTPDQDGTGLGLRGDATTLHLLRKCPVPVWVDDPRTWGRRDVLVAVGQFAEGGEIDSLNRTLMELGSSLAQIQRGELHVVHAWRFEGEQLLSRGRGRLRAGALDAFVAAERTAAEKRLETLGDEFDASGSGVQWHLVHGRPATVIADIVDKVSPGVVVMGTLARAGLPGLIIGNTAERLLGDLQASLIAVKPPGFISPVTSP